MSARKIRKRTLHRMGKCARFIEGGRTVYHGAARRVNWYSPALTDWKTL